MTNRWTNAVAIIAAACISVVFAQVTTGALSMPEGWIKAGSAPQSYDMGTSREEGKRVLVVRSRSVAEDTGFGTIMQQFAADEFKGKSVRFTAKVRSQGVGRTAGLWVRVDDVEHKVIAFDNMNDRAITGTTDWKNYQVVLPVKDTAATISFGILLAGKGEVQMTDISVEPVSAATPSTEKQRPTNKKPSNLNLEK
ncbi:MAG TPA: hypothetical protein PKN64_08185 [Casimicrobium sp.]|jgi:hypothetical protein|nr:hypothetical protein [Casimicrobium sp.]